MFPKYRHTPVIDPDRKRCPVCNLAVYSRRASIRNVPSTEQLRLKRKSRKKQTLWRIPLIALAHVATGDATKTPIATS